MSAHIVRYATASGDRYLQTDPLTWEAALDLWHALEAERLAGDLPWVRYFEVRADGDPTNPALKVRTRPHDRRRDHPAFLRHPGVKLAEAQRVCTFQCSACGRVFQGSGLGVGSHRRACRGLARLGK